MSYLRIKARSWDKNVWCRLLGHIATGYYAEPYGQVRSGAICGTGTEHAKLMVRCDRCDTMVTAAKFHRQPERGSHKESQP